jgi:hypothetical protein
VATEKFTCKENICPFVAVPVINAYHNNN